MQVIPDMHRIVADRVANTINPIDQEKDEKLHAVFPLLLLYAYPVLI